VDRQGDVPMAGVFNQKGKTPGSQTNTTQGKEREMPISVKQREKKKRNDGHVKAKKNVEMGTVWDMVVT